MLEFSLNGSILCVVETSCSFNTTDKRYWYYDIVNWLKNRNGKENEVIDFTMDDNCINWVKKHYFNKVGLGV